MIFVTVGTQVPFDRLVAAVDHWAETRNRTDVFAQTGSRGYVPRHVASKPFIDPAEFRQRVAEASLVVAHAGMGSIITALEIGKPILVMPRRADLKEHRNDHQIATARALGEQGRIKVAMDQQELVAKLDDGDTFRAVATIRAGAAPELLSTIRAFLADGSRPARST